MKTRILSGLAMVPLVALIYLGDLYLTIGAMVICAVAMSEFKKAFSKVGIKVIDIITFPIGLMMLKIAEDGLGHLEFNAVIALGVVVTLLSMLFIKEKPVESSVVTILTIVYIPFLLSHIIAISNINVDFIMLNPNMNLMIWLVFITALGSDTFAYFTGYLFGKHKLCPNISPKKTIEGAIGGIVGSVILSTIFIYFVVNPDWIIHGVILGALGAVAGQMGDLVASMFKRRLEIKDYGSLIPGHGGVLDRIDSILFTAPVVYWYVMLLFVK